MEFIKKFIHEEVVSNVQSQHDIFVDDIYGNKVRTSRSLNMFRENIEWQIYIYALVFSIILICSILVGKYMLSYIYVQIFEENMLERKTDLANKLQDLYDRDFMEDVLYKSDMYN